MNSFILGTCQCPCSTEIDIFSPKSKGRRIGYLRRFLNSAHALKARNQSGENNSQWKGGEPVQDKDGYWLIYSPDHPYRNSRNKVFLHRLLYENYLSILFDEQVYLPEGSEIHHINEDKEDNSLINLKYMGNSLEHKQEHLIDYDNTQCKTCGSKYTPTRSDSKSKRPKWHGNEIDGYQCVSCYKKEYYIRNKERIEKYKEDNRNRILKKQKEYNDTKRKGRGVNK
jgi:predicted Zn-ribbon and HTH transcriptional regulator